MSKLFIGPMSKNIVDTVMEYCDENKVKIGLLPSRRQIEFDGGYVNNWRTHDFINYASKSKNVILQRDHAGPMQGKKPDDGVESLILDATFGFDYLHIDPWKQHIGLDEGIEKTIELIKVCDRVNPECFYEIGTEQAIRPYTPEELETIIVSVKEGLGENLFNKVIYAVIQGGTGIEGTRNIGKFDTSKCKQMIDICRKHGLKSKEHNGDYLTPDDIKKRFKLGLSAINIAPEFGVIETQCILEEILNHFDEKSLNKFYKLCYDSEKWVKWLPSSINCCTNEMKKHVIIRTSGHYVFASEEFKAIKAKFPGVDDKIRRRIRQRIEEILCATK
tara:strand:+ start:1327 stop:2322 length:996 start_codon:yes stop_codon:yes gene_type:complete